MLAPKHLVRVIFSGGAVFPQKGKPCRITASDNPGKGLETQRVKYSGQRAWGVQTNLRGRGEVPLWGEGGVVDRGH